jgi:DNA-binding LacI/PurR family transcriptional regulator/signal transduction histidine kinase
MRIGYLASGLFSSYNSLVWNGIYEACSEAGAVFLYFSGGELRSPMITQSTRNPIFDLATADIVDGLLVNTATTFHYIAPAEALDFMSRRPPVPMVSIGVKLGDWPAVTTDSGIGIGDMVRHLARDHGYSRIAFITGPDKNSESEQRLASFEAALDECGLELRPALVAHGMYNQESGIAAFDLLLESGESFDAVVAANDEMAIGAMNRANALGMQVPRSLAICGFDDIDLAQRLAVTLSTVRQPIKEQAKEACRRLIRQLEGGPRAEDLVLPTSFVRRRSCGCLSGPVERAGRIYAGRAGPPARPARPEEAAAAIRGSIEGVLGAMELGAPAPAAPPADAGGRVLEALCRAIEEGDARPALLEAEDSIMQAAAKGFEDYIWWQDLVSELSARCSPLVGAGGPALERFDAFWHQLRILVHELAYQSQYRDRLRDAQAAIRLRETNWKLIQCFETDKLMRTIAAEFPKQGVKACYLCVGGELCGSGEPARLLMAYDESGPLEVPPGGMSVPEGRLVPPEAPSLDRPGVFFVEALFFEAELLGYVVFRTDPAVVPFEELRRQVSSALKGAFLSDEVRSLAAEERQRAAELGEALDALRKNGQKMLAIEKMASLGRLTAGLAHEMNTPLGTIRMAASELDTRIEEYRSSIAEPEAAARDPEVIAGEMAELNAMVQKAAERTVSFVQSIKTQTRDLSKAEPRNFDAVPVIEEAVLLLNPQIRKGNCPVEFRHSWPTVIIKGVAGRLAQVVTNLINNAIEASIPKGGGPILLELETDGEGATLTVRDRGTGIADGVMPHIFDPLFTTKSMADGTGLGLTIVYDIITGDFGGTIQAASPPGEGAVFTLTFPKPKEDG